jgi:hypothetical protein
MFVRSDGQTIAPPSVTEFFAGSGVYSFSYGTTQSIAFLADAATTSPGSQGRYVMGSIDPADRGDEYGSTLVAIGTSNIALGTTNVALGTTNVALGTSNIALGTTNIAIGTTLTAIATTLAAQSASLSGLVLAIGSTASSFGTSSVDPVDLFGFMKRVMENLEGNETFYKASGNLVQYSRGSSVTLWSKTIANSTSLVVKS